jgi:hypothetical protein
MTQNNVQELPYFLRSYEDLRQHLDTELEKTSSSVDKGFVFAKFASQVIPLSEYGSDFDNIELNSKKSRDGGIDLYAQSNDASKILYGQSKVTIRQVDDIDLIISKFKDFYEKNHKSKNLVQLSFEAPKSDSTRQPTILFLIVSLSKVTDRIIMEFEKSKRPSRTFYDKLKSENRIFILDGPKILPLVQAAYRKMHVLPSNIRLKLVQPPLVHENVYIGVISSQELKSCYDQFGDALFFENIREFLGFAKAKSQQKTNVNGAILHTAENEPDKMLARNNGITFRASKIDLVDDQTLFLHVGSIVNGCQTTVCIVNASEQNSYIVVKVVETPEFWDITKAANYQNRVEQIDLEIAKYIRPSLAKRAAKNLGLQIESNTEKSIFDVFDSIYNDRITYEEVYYLFLGLFSKKLGNVLKADYLRLRRYELLEEFSEQDPDGEKTFPILFELCKLAQLAQKTAEETYNRNKTYKNMFKRFWYDNKSDYRSIFIILAAFGSIDAESLYIYESDSFTDISQFLEKVRAVIEGDKEKYIRYYLYAFEATAIFLLSSNKDEVERLRTMYDDIRNANFDNLYASLRIIADGREVQVNETE